MSPPPVCPRSGADDRFVRNFSAMRVVLSCKFWSTVRSYVRSMASVLSMLLAATGDVN